MRPILIISLFLASHFSLAESVRPASTFKIDSDHSKVGFSVPHLKISTVEGSFTMVDGIIDLHEKFEESTVRVEVDTNSVNTGVDKRDDHLRSEDFFHTQKFPSMTFISTKIEGAQEQFKLSGKLTIKGVTRLVTFDTRFIGIISAGLGNDKAAFIGSTKINRHDFGISWNQMLDMGAVIGDEVQIDLRILASRPSKSTALMYEGVMKTFK